MECAGAPLQGAAAVLRALLRAGRECRVSAGCEQRPERTRASRASPTVAQRAPRRQPPPLASGSLACRPSGWIGYLRAVAEVVEVVVEEGHTYVPRPAGGIRARPQRGAACVRHVCAACVRGMCVRHVRAACVRGMLARGPPSPLLLLSENELERLLRGASLPAPGLCASSASLRVDESAQLLLESRPSTAGSAGAEAGLKKPKPKMPRFAGLGEGFGAAAGAPRWHDGCEGGRSSPGLERGRV